MFAFCQSLLWVAFSSTSSPPPPHPPSPIPRFETDRIPSGWADRCNDMDEVWVPTPFHVETFAVAGVARSKLVVMPEPVDVDFFDTDRTTPLGLPLGTRVFKKKKKKNKTVTEKTVAEEIDPRPAPAAAKPPPMRFLSVFKWERRKGWDVLLEAFVTAFARIIPDPDADGPESDLADLESLDTDPAPPTRMPELYLLTNRFHTDESLLGSVRAFVRRFRRRSGRRFRLPPIRVIDEHIAAADMPRLYKRMDAFVLPTRGEGWGRPIVEAMAMGLPVIATNWSGPTAYLTETNSYPLPIDGLEPIPDGPFSKFHQWARPSLDELVRLLRLVAADPVGRAARGRQARRDMVERFHPNAVASLVAARLQQIYSTRDMDS